MKLTELFTAQLDREAPICRRVLERVPEHKADWKPHEKSMPLGYLSGLVASMPSWVAMAVELNELDLNPPGGTPLNSARSTRARRWSRRSTRRSRRGGRRSRARTTSFLMTPWKLLVAASGPGVAAPRRDRGHLHPPGPPPRPAQRLPAAERGGGAVDLRAVGRRQEVRLSRPSRARPRATLSARLGTNFGARRNRVACS